MAASIITMSADEIEQRLREIDAEKAELKDYERWRRSAQPRIDRAVLEAVARRSDELDAKVREGASVRNLVAQLSNHEAERAWAQHRQERAAKAAQQPQEAPAQQQ